MAVALDTTMHPLGITSGPHVFQVATKATAITTAPFSTAGANRLLMLLFSGPSSGGGATSISSVTTSGGSFSSPFARLVSKGAPSGNGVSEIWWAINSATLSAITVTANINPNPGTGGNSGNYGTLSVIGFTGMPLSAPTNFVTVEDDTAGGTIAATITGTGVGSWVIG